MRYLSLLAVTVLALALLTGCSDDTSDPVAVTSPAAAVPLNLDDLATALTDMELKDLTPDDTAGLVYMREEEKLARDVYLTFADQYALNVFTNISASEQKHMDAVLLLLDRYEITDPIGDNAQGVFQDETLQALHDDLIATGGESLEEALLVGCAIEEIDILDLMSYSAETTPADILLVYGHLLAGSSNHLRAYVSQWEQATGQTYEPRYLSVEDFEAIMAATNGHGGQGRGGHRGRHGGGDGSCRN